MGIKKIIIVGFLIAMTTVAAASFENAFSSDEGETESENKTIATSGQKNKKQNSLANIEDFKMWLGTYKGVNEAEKNIAFGMMEQNETKAYLFFSTACDQGDERGCFQLALNELGQQKAKGLDRLHDLALSGKNKEVSQKSAQLLGAYILDFASFNKSAVTQSLEAVLPHAANGDATSQFVAANLFLANGIVNEADMMLTKACNNPNAGEKIINFCNGGQNVEMLDENGEVMTLAKSETGSCSK